MKKLNIVILIVLLMFQTILSPISVFADGGDAGAGGGTDLPGTEETQLGSEDSEEPGAGESQGSLSGGIQTLSSSPDTAGVTIEENVPDSVINKIDMLVNGKSVYDTDFDLTTYRPKNGDSINLSFYFTLDNGHKYGNGSKLEYTLPAESNLVAASGGGDLYDPGSQGHIKLGTYSVENRKVIITFNDNIRTDEGKLGLPVTNGQFEIIAHFNLQSEDLSQSVILKGHEEIFLKFMPTNGKKVDKNGISENAGNASSYVDWTINANTEMVDLGDNGKQLKDTLKGNHTYDITSFVVTRQKLDINGEGIIEPETINDPSIQFAIDNKSFSLLLTGDYAYTIKYKTIPEETDSASQDLNNDVEFNGGLDNDNKQTIQYGTPLEKTVSGDKNNATWTIKLNHNRKTLGTTEDKFYIEDTWTGPHVFAGDPEFTVKKL